MGQEDMKIELTDGMYLELYNIIDEVLEECCTWIEKVCPGYFIFDYHHEKLAIVKPIRDRLRDNKQLIELETEEEIEMLKLLVSRKIAKYCDIATRDDFTSATYFMEVKIKNLMEIMNRIGWDK